MQVRKSLLVAVLCGKEEEPADTSMLGSRIRRPLLWLYAQVWACRERQR